MNETAIILRERLKSLEETLGLDDRDFAFALFDYCAFISSSEILSKIVKRMALDRDIDAQVFQWLFIFGALRNTVRNFKLGKMDKGESGFPLFWDKEIEELYGVGMSLGKLLYISKDRFYKGDSDSIDIYQIISDDDGNLILDETVPVKHVIIKFRLLQNELLSQMIESPAIKVFFDAERSVLIIGKTEVKFRKHTDQFHTLRVIFYNQDEVKKEWFFSEIGEKMDKYKQYSNKDLHNYLSAIKKRVSVETSLSDIFITTNQSVKINGKYLK